MSEQDLKQDQEAIEDSQPTELDEFKASMGDPSEVPEPTSTKAAAPGPSKDQGDKMPPKQGSSMKAPMPKEDNAGNVNTPGSKAGSKQSAAKANTADGTDGSAKKSAIGS